MNKIKLKFTKKLWQFLLLLFFVEIGKEEYNLAKVNFIVLDKAFVEGSLRIMSSRNLEISRIIVEMEASMVAVEVILSYLEVFLKKWRHLEGFNKGKVERGILCLKLQIYRKKDQLC